MITGFIIGLFLNTSGSVFYCNWVFAWESIWAVLFRGSKTSWLWLGTVAQYRIHMEKQLEEIKKL